MRWHCKGMQDLGDKCREMHAGKAFFGLFMLFYMVTAIILTFRITSALETMAMASALDELDENLSDDEKDELASRVRENLFD